MSVALDPSYLQALSLFEGGDLEGARKLLESIVENLPLESDAQNDLGAIYFLQGLPEKALGPASIALALDSRNTSYRENFDAIISALRRTSERTGNFPIRLAMFYDEEGWAWWIRSHAIKRSLPADFEVNILQLNTFVDHTKYDFLLIFDHNIVREVRGITEIPKEKIVLANSCPLYILEADQSLKANGYPAAIVNNLTAFKKLNSDRRWHCCENGVDTSLFVPPKTRPTSFMAGWVGNSLSIGQKGLDIIEAACRLADVPLLIVDAKDKPKDIKANSQEWLRDNLYHKTSVYLCASLYEGTPNPALEALACALPVISTAVGNIPELIKDGVNGYIVERNVEAMAAAIRAVKEKDLSEAARNTVSPSWDWSVKAQNYANIFRALKRDQPVAHGG